MLVVMFVLLFPILVANAAIFVPKSTPASVAALTIVTWLPVRLETDIEVKIILFIVRSSIIALAAYRLDVFN